MGKSTPGPWGAEPETGRGAWIKGASGEWTALACGDTDASARANAALIAAAPDLLAACEALITYDERPDDGPNAGIQMMVDYDHALTLARAAAARALPNPDTEGATS